MSTVLDSSAESLALKAWRELSPGAPEPGRIETLKDVGFPLAGSVHRICGAGPRGTNVVAKRTHESKATAERAVYEQLLPSLPVRAAAYYGAVPEPDTGFCWLFLEEVRGRPVSPARRGLMAEWLAALHTGASALPRPAELPSKGLGYYLEIVEVSQKQIAESVAVDELQSAEREMLTQALDDLDCIEVFWGDLVGLCAGLPETLVHGDFVAKNLIVDGGGEIVALDWGSSGWGMPATDLRYVDAARYQAGVSALCPDLSVHAIERAAIVGHVFFRIARLRGVTEGLPEQWSLRRLKHRRRKLSEALRAIGWS